MPPPSRLVLSPVAVGYDEEGREVTSCFVRSQSAMEAASEDTEATRSILEALGRPAARRDGMLWRELQEATHVPKATLSRQLWTLRDFKRVEKRGGRYFLAGSEDQK